MQPLTEREIRSSRNLSVDAATAYQAFSNTTLLAQWWGPEGFTNTLHEFDLRPGGNWRLTMHGPAKGHYENASVFTTVEPGKRVGWSRHSQPLFDMEILWEPKGDAECTITFRMMFPTPEECSKMRLFVVPKNEENFDRLERLLAEQGSRK